MVANTPNSIYAADFLGISPGRDISTTLIPLTGIENVNNIIARGDLGKVPTLKDNYVYSFQPAGSNTESPNIRINAIPAKNILRRDGTDLEDGDLEGEGPAVLVWSEADDVFYLIASTGMTANLQGAITTNAGDISTNATNISTNASNISTNATNISNLFTVSNDVSLGNGSFFRVMTNALPNDLTKMIVLNIEGLEVSTTEDVYIYFGDDTGVPNPYTTGYTAGGTRLAGGASTDTYDTSGFLLPSVTAGEKLYGSITFTNIGNDGSRWGANGSFFTDGGVQYIVSGTCNFTSVVQSIGVAIANATYTFQNNGTFNYAYIANV